MLKVKYFFHLNLNDYIKKKCTFALLTLYIRKMKLYKNILSSFFLILLSTSLLAQDKMSEVCRWGFTYEWSLSKNWGKNKLVVIQVDPYSNAAKAGLKENDIIVAINDVLLERLDHKKVAQVLDAANKSDIKLTVKSLGSPLHQTLVKRDCKVAQAIGEKTLADAFSFYSLETCSNRTFVCPYKVTFTPQNIAFDGLETYTFAPIDPNNLQLEEAINASIGKCLTSKGLERTEGKADIEVQTFYYFTQNKDFTGEIDKKAKESKTFRLDCTDNSVKDFPFYAIDTPVNKAAYTLQLGVRLVSHQGNKDLVLWECEANELLKEPYDLSLYAQKFMPLMLKSFPYGQSVTNETFVVHHKIYNYTGINYNINHLNEVESVDQNSPAWKEGLREGDQINRINGLSLDYSSDDFTKGYKAFIQATIKYRDKNTRFTNIEGFRQCMFWKSTKYEKVASMLEKEEYKAGFSYLFFYAPYINPTLNNVCVFEVVTGNRSLMVRPELRTINYIEIK